MASKFSSQPVDRAHVVLAQRVDVAHLEPPALEERHRLADRPHVHVGGDERLDERSAAGVAVAAAGAGHLLDQHPPAGLDRVVQDLGVGAVVLLADVLAHLDRGDRVEGSTGCHLGDLAVVLQPDLDAVLEAALADALRR